MITTDDLRFFLSLAATSSLAQAARALDVTPPAVTQRLHALEKRLGVRLVNRSKVRRERLIYINGLALLESIFLLL